MSYNRGYRDRSPSPRGGRESSRQYGGRDRDYPRDYPRDRDYDARGPLGDGGGRYGPPRGGSNNYGPAQDRRYSGHYDPPPPPGPLPLPVFGGYPPPPPPGRQNSYHSEPQQKFREERNPPADSRYNDYNVPSSVFTFRVEQPAGVAGALYDSYQPQRDREEGSKRSRIPGRRNDRHGEYADRQRSGNPRGRGGYGGAPYMPKPAAERAILFAKHLPATEMLHNGDGNTYRALADLTDDDQQALENGEADMEIVDGDSDGSEEPRVKRVKLEGAGDGDSMPKWSNPDPYTALPPPDESQRRKKDVVQLIRKARVAPTNGEKANNLPSLPMEPDEYISFDFDDSDAGSDRRASRTGLRERAVQNPPGVVGAPTGPKAEQTRKYVGAENVSGVTEKKSLPATESDYLSSALPANLPPRPPPPLTSSSTVAGKKRTFDGELKPPAHAKLTKPNMKAPPGDVLVQWRAKPSEESCPWLCRDHSGTPKMGVWLHKEIVDFYNHVKPRDYEIRVRSELVERLRAKVRRTWPDVDILAFGSFKSGLFLPTADMDLVFCSQTYRRGGPAQYLAPRILHRFRGWLNSNRIPLEDVEVVSKAKVPLVKYVDRETGIKVDISFENMSGVEAIDTFTRWKQEFPAMPILATLVKQFLAMRGLNEPVNGGLGGFSVIALVVSMLQMMPAVQSRNLIPEHHLGDMLMEFFDLYGNQFDYENIAITLNPPGYIPKNNASIMYRAMDRVSILDPNRADNDISGGAKNTRGVFQTFSSALRRLQDRMAEVAASPQRERVSLLETILAGDYSTFHEQRQYMAKVHNVFFGDAPEVHSDPGEIW